MVNHKTQFTIDFIGDKNLLEFYTHYIMQRRLLLCCASTLIGSTAASVLLLLQLLQQSEGGFYTITSHCKCVVRIFHQNYIAVKLGSLSLIESKFMDVGMSVSGVCVRMILIGNVQKRFNRSVFVL